MSEHETIAGIIFAALAGISAGISAALGFWPMYEMRKNNILQMEWAINTIIFATCMLYNLK